MNLIPRDLIENQEIRELLEMRANRAVQGEQEALFRHSGTEYRTRVLLEEQRSQTLSEGRFELLLQETRAEHAVDSIERLNRQLRSQDTEICRRGQEYEVARQEYVLLQAELQSREIVHQEARSRSTQEVEESKRPQEWRMDEFSRQELRESQSTVNERTAQI